MTPLRTQAPRAGRRHRIAVRAGYAAAMAVAVAAGAGCSAERAVAVDTGCVIPASVTAAGHTVVEVRGYAFTPALVRVSAGETVTWVNCELRDTDQHTATSDAGAWTSAYFGAGDHVSRTFGTAGTFSYHCEPHPFMKGTVEVE